MTTPTSNSPIASTSIATAVSGLAETADPKCLQTMLWISGIFFAPQLVGSAFNIWYNLLHIRPLLTADQLHRFGRAIIWVNVILYPLAIAVGMAILWSIRPCFLKICSNEPVDLPTLNWARARVINLPWWALGVAGTCWLLCIPIFLFVLQSSPEPVDPRVYLHLPASLLISGSIAVSIGFFLMELSVLRWLYPPFFAALPAHGIPGAIPLTLRGRGAMWAISSCLCPIGCLLLLTLEPESLQGRGAWFALTVGGVAASFGIISAWASSNLLLEPVHDLRRVAAAVRSGDLQTRATVQRADEFGPLIETVNDMLHELREKQRVQELFGRHVGRDAARQLLEQSPAAPEGMERELTVMFADLRGFTARAEHLSAAETVALLNGFFTEMVDVIENVHGGMVNKFLGDGLMALFGAMGSQELSADAAVNAAVDMLDRLNSYNRDLGALHGDPLKMGIGICTGPAVVGSIGSQRRGEFTAMGSTINIASRIEAHTKQVPYSILLCERTARCLAENPASRLAGQLVALSPTPIRGLDKPLPLFAVTGI